MFSFSGQRVASSCDDVSEGSRLPRRRLRLVCRALNEYFICTSHGWLQLDGPGSLVDDQGRVVCELDSSTSTGGRGVGPVERLSLSTMINPEELTTHIISRILNSQTPPPPRAPARVHAPAPEDPRTGVQPLR